MRKFLILIVSAVLFLSGSCNKTPTPVPEEEAHFSVYDKNMHPLENNKEFTFHTTDQSADLSIRVKNNTNRPIFIKTRLVTVSGTDGSQFEVCMGTCYPSMQLHTLYPVGQDFKIEAGETTSAHAIHYWNHYDGDCSYEVEILEVDDSGNKIGKSFKFKYIHN